jgi:hypothetical protein
MVFLYVCAIASSYVLFLFVYIQLRFLKFSFLPPLFFICLVTLQSCLAIILYLQFNQCLVYMVGGFHSSILDVLYSFRLDIRVLIIPVIYRNICLNQYIYIYIYIYIYDNQSIPAVATLCFLFLNTPYSPSSQHVSALRATIR